VHEETRQAVAPRLAIGQDANMRALWIAVGGFFAALFMMFVGGVIRSRRSARQFDAGVLSDQWVAQHRATPDQQF
jgi:hypothetical protein